MNHELAARIAAHPRFEPSAGMRMVPRSGVDLPWSHLRFRAEDEWTVDVSYVNRGEWGVQHEDGYVVDSYVHSSDYVPDLDDPATQGCLWAMLCESQKLYGRTIDGMIECLTLGSAREWSGARGDALAEAVLDTWGDP